MGKSFWRQLKKPILVLAPMEDVTDFAFRHIIAKYSKGKGGNYVTYTEFVAADGLVFADEKGRKKLLSKLKYSEIERPIVAQIFSSKPENIEKAARIAEELGFDGVDINMGCPDRSIEKQGAGAALIKNPDLAVELIEAAQRGAPHLPISVKTRIGYAENEVGEWVPKLLETGIEALTIHARTRNELSKVPANWEVIKQVVEIRDALQSNTLIIGNGDVRDVEDAYKKAKESGADGVMIGRGIFGNPWGMSAYKPTLKEKLVALIEHTKLFENTFADIKSFATMKKHFASYVAGFEGAKEMRIQLMEADNAQGVAHIIENTQQ